MLFDHMLFPRISSGHFSITAPIDIERQLYREQGVAVQVGGSIPFDQPSTVLTYDPEANACSWTDLPGFTMFAGRGLVIDTTRGGQVITTCGGRNLVGVPCGTQKPVACDPLNEPQGILVPSVRTLRNTPPPLTVSELDTTPFRSFGGQATYTLKPCISLDVATGYVLGLICGDGWPVKDKSYVSGVALAKTKMEVVACFEKCLASFFSSETPPRREQETTRGNYGKSIKHTFSSVEFGRLVEALCGQGAENKHLPGFFFCAPPDFRQGLFAGLMDSDGSVSISNAKKKPQLLASFTSISQQMIREVRWLAMSLGIAGTITPTQTPAGLPSYILGFSNVHVQQWGGQYMADAKRLGILRNFPAIEMSPILAGQDLVPISAELARLISRAIGAPKITKAMREDPCIDLRAKNATLSLYSTFMQASKKAKRKFGAVTRYTALKALEISKVMTIQHPDMAEFRKQVENTEITWNRITGIRQQHFTDAFFSVESSFAGDIVTMDGFVASAKMEV